MLTFDIYKGTENALAEALSRINTLRDRLPPVVDSSAMASVKKQVMMEYDVLSSLKLEVVFLPMCDSTILCELPQVSCNHFVPKNNHHTVFKSTYSVSPQHLHDSSSSDCLLCMQMGSYLPPVPEVQCTLA